MPTVGPHVWQLELRAGGGLHHEESCQRGRRGANSSRERTDGVQQVDVDGGARAPGIIEPDGRACGGSRSGGRMLPAELRCMWLHVRGSSKRREQILVDSARDQRELLGPVQSALGADSGSHSKSSQCKHGPRARCEALGRSIEKRLMEAGEASMSFVQKVLNFLVSLT